MENEKEGDNFNNFGGGRGRGRGLGRGRRWLGDNSLMDNRLVEPALMIFLNQQKLHGYGLLEKLAGIGLSDVNPGVIYRILRNYEEMGLVESEWDADTTQGPPKRVYTVTAEGQVALTKAVASLEDTMHRIQSLLGLFESKII